MAESHALQQSPLVLAKYLQQSNVVPAHAGVQLGEKAMLAYINVRGHGDAFADAIQQATGIEAPSIEALGTANTCHTEAEQTLYWLGPDEYLLRLAENECEARLGQLREALSDQHAAVTDNSSGLTTITISGAQARAVLAKGSPLDLHPRVFGVGQCAQTLLAKAAVVLVPTAENSYDIIVRRSFADYLWRWLVDAAEEYGVAVI